MKKILMIIGLVFLLTGHGWGADRLVPTNWLDTRYYSSDATYAYGLNSSSQRFVVKLDTLGNQTTGVDIGSVKVGSIISRVWVGNTAGELFIQAAVAGKFYLWYSVDNGDNVGDNSPNFDDGDYVSIIGDTDGTEGNQIATVSILPRGFAVDTTNSQYLYGEYNVNGSRTPGAANDQVRVMKASFADPTTWTEVVHWNTDGANTNVRHCHAIRYNSETGESYICNGDSDAESGILLWDGTTALADNVAMSTYPDVLTGSQDYRTVDILFTSGKIHWISDADTTPHRIFRSDTDLTDVEIRSVEPGTYDNHAGALGIKTAGNALIFTEYLVSGYDDAQMNIWVSDDGGDNYVRSGVFTINTDAGASSIQAFMEFNGNIYMSDNAGAGKQLFGSSLFQVSGSFDDDYPTVIHPVYWIDNTNGTDAVGPQGWSSDSPWANIRYALVGDKIVHGSGIRFIGDTTDSGSSFTDADWDAGTRPADGKTSVPLVVVTGNGVTNTILTTAASQSYIFNIQEQEVGIRFEKLSFLPLGSKAISLRNAHFQLYKAKGDCTTSNAGFITGQVAAGGTIEFLKSTFVGGVTGTALYNTENLDKISIKFCESTGFDTFLNNEVGDVITDFVFMHNEISDHITRGLYFEAAITNMFVFNNIFEGASGASEIVDEAGITETDAMLDYNYYLRGLTGIANDGGFNRIDQLDQSTNGGIFVADENDTGISDSSGDFIFKLPNVGEDQGAGAPKGGQRILSIGGGFGIN